MKKITSILLSVAMLIVVAVVFSGCGGPSKDAIYPNSVEVKGTNGHGKISKYLSDSLVRTKRDMAEKTGNDDLYNHYKGLHEIYDDCKVEVVEGNNGKLSNGDVVTLKITSNENLDEKSLDELGFTKNEISFDEFKYEVQGLKEPKIVEVKKDEIKLEYKGYSGSATTKVVSSNSCKAIKYKLSKSKDLSNGDVVTVTPSISEDNDVYALNKYSKEFDFTVSGLPEFPDTLDGIDTSEVDNFMTDYVNNGGCEPHKKDDSIEGYLLHTTNKIKSDVDNISSLTNIENVTLGKLQDDTVEYYKFKNVNRTIYSKKLKIDYDVVVEDNNTDKKHYVKGSEDVIVYANVVVVDGKLHLANYYYDSDDTAYDYNTDYEYDTDKPYLSDYKEGRDVIDCRYGDVISYFRSNSDETTDEVYQDYIKENDKLSTDED